MEKVYIVKYHQGTGALAVCFDAMEAMKLCKPTLSSCSGKIEARTYEVYSMVDYLQACKEIAHYASLQLKIDRCDEVMSEDTCTSDTWGRFNALRTALVSKQNKIAWIDGEMQFNALGMSFTKKLWARSCREWSKQ